MDDIENKIDNTQWCKAGESAEHAEPPSILYAAGTVAALTQRGPEVRSHQQKNAGDDFYNFIGAKSHDDKEINNKNQTKQVRQPIAQKFAARYALGDE